MFMADMAVNYQGMRLIDELKNEVYKLLPRGQEIRVDCIPGDGEAELHVVLVDSNVMVDWLPKTDRLFTGGFDGTKKFLDGWLLGLTVANSL